MVRTESRFSGGCGVQTSSGVTDSATPMTCRPSHSACTCDTVYTGCRSRCTELEQSGDGHAVAMHPAWRIAALVFALASVLRPAEAFNRTQPPCPCFNAGYCLSTGKPDGSVYCHCNLVRAGLSCKCGGCAAARFLVQRGVVESLGPGPALRPQPADLLRTRIIAASD